MKNYTKLDLLGVTGSTTPTFRLTCTTTGAATATIQDLTAATGKTVRVNWGDGSYNDYTGAGTRTHNYAGAGIWNVSMSNRLDITSLNLGDAKFGGTINAANPLPSGLTTLILNGLSGLTYNVNTNPLPSGLTYLYLNGLSGLTYNVNTNPLPSGLTYLNLYGLSGLTYNVNTNPLPSGLTYLNLNSLSGLTYNVNTNPLPSGLTYLYLYGLSGLTWIINASQPCPTGVTTLTTTICPNITCTAWTHNGIRSIQAENGYNQANVDAWLYAVLANKANFTYATPVLDLLGNGNAAPSGIYQAADPVTSGNEAKYALVNGNGSYAAGPEWTVQTA